MLGSNLSCPVGEPPRRVRQYRSEPSCHFGQRECIVIGTEWDSRCSHNHTLPKEISPEIYFLGVSHPQKWLTLLSLDPSIPRGRIQPLPSRRNWLAALRRSGPSPVFGSATESTLMTPISVCRQRSRRFAVIAFQASNPESALLVSFGSRHGCGKSVLSVTLETSASLRSLTSYLWRCLLANGSPRPTSKILLGSTLSPDRRSRGQTDACCAPPSQKLDTS